MNRLPILLGANPRALKRGATIPLKAGNYRVVFENIVDTRIYLEHDPIPGQVNTAIEIHHGYVFTLTNEMSNIWARVVEVGKEPSINVYLEDAA